MSNNNTQFDEKWSKANQNKKTEERTLFVREGEVPVTQRQFNLFHYFDFISKEAKEFEVKKSLEIGCGRGTISIYLNKYLGVETVATDISDEAIALAKENFSIFDAEGTILKADATALPFPDGSFDMVVSIGLLEHLEDYAPIISEEFRVLRPGGIMVSINIPKKFSIQYFNHLYRIVLRLFPRVVLNKDYPRNSHTPLQYKKTAEAVGFTRVETMYVNPFPLFTPLYGTIEHLVAFTYRLIYSVRGLLMTYPLKGSALLSQAHFLTGVKPLAEK